jgi:hypothetical protein
MTKKTPRKKKKTKKTAKKPGRPERQERKDRLIQTRITPSLYDKVVQRAEALRIPVSNLIRIILEGSPKLVEGVVDESINIVGALKDGAPPAKSALPDLEPVAWQPVTLGRRVACGECARQLYPAQPAHMGIGEDGKPLLIACPDCYESALKRAK